MNRPGIGGESSWVCCCLVPVTTTNPALIHLSLTGALFLHRRNHRSVLMEDDADDIDAVRINVPLSRVETIEKTKMIAIGGLISVTFDPKSSNIAMDDGSTEHHDPIPHTENKEDIAFVETAPDKQVLQLGVLGKDFEWDNVMSYVNKAKTSASESSVDWPGSRVYIDVDPWASNSSESSDSNLSRLVRSVSYSLGLDTTKGIWSASRLLLLLQLSHVFSVMKAHIYRLVMNYYGHLAVNAEYLGFLSKSIAGGDIHYRIPLSRVKAVKPHDRRHARDYTLLLEIQGRHDVRLGFSTEKKRDEAVEQIRHFIGLSQEHHAYASSPTSLTGPSLSSFGNENQAQSRGQSLDQASESIHSSRDEGAPHTVHHLAPQSTTSVLAPLSRLPSIMQKHHMPHALKSFLPKAINLPGDFLLSMPSKHFVCLTIGSRGDVQPYIALGRGLQKEGHKVTIVTHEEYKKWVTDFGLEHRTAGGDPGALMKLSVENKVFKP
jgi:sterol 3beta-glucosyltransferase